MPLFCNKTLRDSNKNFRVFIWWMNDLACSCVHPQYRSRTFLVDLDGRHIFASTPIVAECICGWCIRDLDFKSMTNLS
jgi:hypothetical protein